MIKDEAGRNVAPDQTLFVKSTLEQFLEQQRLERELASERLAMHMERLR